MTYKYLKNRYGDHSRTGWHGPPRTRRRRYRNKGGEALHKVNKILKERERKGIIVNTGHNVAAGGAAQITNLFGITRGSSQNQRDGDKISVASIAFRMHARTLSAETGCVYRFMIVYDRHPHQALPTITQLMQSDNPNSQYMQMDRQFAGRFEFMYDESWSLSDSTGRMVTMKWSTNKARISTFNQNLGTIADFDHGSYLLVSMANHNVGIIDVDWQAVVRFTDS